MSSPPVKAPPARQLAAVLARLGLPPPVRVEVPPRRWVHANYRLFFRGPPGALLLRRVLHSPGYDSLANEHAALRLVGGRASLPVVRSYQVLPEGSLPWPAALSQLLPGRDGVTVMRADPSQGPRVVREVGRAMARLAEIRSTSHGLRGDRGRFLATHRTWREEWLAQLAFRLADALDVGTDLGPLSRALVERIEDRLPALDQVESFALLHRDLHPPNLLFVGDGDHPRLSGVVDWEGAGLGDPLAEWAQPLQFRVEALSHLARGYGVERVRDLLQADSLARLEVYASTRCVARLGFTAMPMFAEGRGRLRAHALEVAASLCREALETGWVRRKLLAALDLSVQAPVRLWSRPPPTALLRRRALDALRHAPRVGAAEASLLAGALCLAALVEARVVPEWAVDLGAALVDRLGPQEQSERTEAIDDRPRWREDLIEQVLAQGSVEARAVLWVGLHAVDQVESAVPDSTLRGLQELVQSLPAERSGQAGPPAREVWEGVVGLAASRGLGSDEEAPGLRAAWEQLPEAARSALVDPAGWRGAPPLQLAEQAVFLYAFRCLDDVGLT